jgi:hypothetical protein
MPQAMIRKPGMTIFHVTDRGPCAGNIMEQQLYRSIPAPTAIKKGTSRRHRVQQVFWAMVLMILGAMITMGFCAVLMERCGRIG